MSETGVFAFKTAPVGRRVAVRVEGGRIALENPATGEVRKSLTLAGLSRARWSETGLTYMAAAARDQRLILGGIGGSLILRCVDSAAPPLVSPDTEQFLRAAAAALRAAAAENPGLSVVLGAGAGVAWLYMAVATLTLLVGVVCAAAGVEVFEKGDIFQGLGLCAVGVCFSITGVVTARSFNPLRRRMVVPADALATELEARLAGGRG